MSGDTAPAAPEQRTFLPFLIEPHSFPPVSQRPVTHAFLGVSLVPGNKLAADPGVPFTPEPVPQGPAGALGSIQHPLPPHIHILPTISERQPLTPGWGLDENCCLTSIRVMRQTEPENSDFHTQGPSRIDQLVEGWSQSPITLFSAVRP